MASSDVDDLMTTKMDVVRSAWNEIRAHLETEKKRINNEIGCYPTPIAGCDQQFNHLLEQRTGLSGEWSRLNANENQSLSAEDPINVIDDFIRSSNYINQEAAESIRLRLNQELSELQG